MIKKDADTKKMEPQLKNWGKELEKLAAQAGEAEQEVRTVFQGPINGAVLHRRRNEKANRKGWDVSR